MCCRYLTSDISDALTMSVWPRYNLHFPYSAKCLLSQGEAMELPDLGCCWQEDSSPEPHAKTAWFLMQYDARKMKFKIIVESFFFADG